MVGGAPARDAALGASHCTGRGQGQGLDAAGQEDREAQLQKPEVIVMVLQSCLVTRVGHGEATVPDLFGPVQLAEAVFPQAQPVPAGGHRGSARAGWAGLGLADPPASLCCSAP